MGLFAEQQSRLQILGKKNIEKIHEATLFYLEKKGVVIDNKRGKEILSGCGASVEANKALIPKSSVEAALEKVPKSFCVHDRMGNLSLELDGKHSYFGVSSDSLYYKDPITKQVLELTSEHAGLMARMADGLEHVDFVGNGGLLADKDPRIGGRLNVAFSMQNTSLPLTFCPDFSESYADIIALAQDLRGGAQELRDKPYVIGYCEPIPPLTHNDDGVKKLLLCADAGIPVIYMPYCMRGGTSPITFAGTLVQCFAEILSGLVLHQGAAPGAPFICGAMPSILDMKTSVGSYGAIELHLGEHAAWELSEFYGLPYFGAAGCADSKHMDIQTGVESTLSMVTSLTSGADLIHDLGVLDHCNIISPELLVLNNEVIDMLSSLKKTPEISDKELSLDVLAEVGPGGDFLTHDQTLFNFKEKIWYSDIFDRSGKEQTSEHEVNNRIREKAISIIENHQPEALNDNQAKIIQEHIKSWENKID